MNATAEKSRATVRKRTAGFQRASRSLSTLSDELEAMKACTVQITKSKEASLAFLIRAGILDEKGDLTKPYRT